MEKNGFVILDKPAGLTSFDCCEKIKEIFGAKKAGHAGTLDLNVTGVLIIAINNSCKLMPLLERLDKEYIGIAQLHKEVPVKQLKEVIKKFTGKIKQIPPRRSRVARRERIREIYEFKILKKEKRNFHFFVACEAGTYIRKLIHDMGLEIGGAHLVSLRRIKQGVFSEKESAKIEEIKKDPEKFLISPEEIIKRLKLPKIILKKNSIEKLKKGQFLLSQDFEKRGYFEANQLLPCFYENRIVALVRPLFDSERIKKEKGYVIKPERII